MADGGSCKTSVDLATILGLVGAFALIGAAMVLGGSPGSFIDVPSILIVIGGTIAVTMISFSISDMVKAAMVVTKTFISVDYDPSWAANRVMQLSEMARKKGGSLAAWCRREPQRHPVPAQGGLDGGRRHAGGRG